MRLTADELAALPAKAKRDPEVVKLYQSHDYATAYALHTDRRVLSEGAATAAGADASRDNWDTHGDLQRDFLIHSGLQPHHRLLEIGCGGGRLARKIVPYLEIGHYHGVDISSAAIDAAADLALEEGWAWHLPTFWQHIEVAPLSFEFIWAHSVFTHLPVPMIEQVMREAGRRLASSGSVFLWTYIPSNQTERYGLTQFRTTLEDYAACAARAGLTFDEVPNWVRATGYEPGRWTYGQSVAVSRRIG